MAAEQRKINPEDDLGFGPLPVVKNQPLINKDGSPNVRRVGLPFFNTLNSYQTLITMSWTRFWVMVVIAYLVINIGFAFIYMMFGPQGLDGTTGNSLFDHFMDSFFFSAQTISTVGYGHISPRGIGSNSVAAFESMIGLLAFALAAGLLYGRFSRPYAKIAYSENMLVSPYLDGQGLMFRLANLRKNLLIDLEVEVIYSYNDNVNGKEMRKFFPLKLERTRVSVSTLNWTVVHPIDADSPLHDVKKEDLLKSEAGFAVLLKAFDDSFAQTVHSRTSYQADELVWGAKFVPAFDRDKDGRIMLDLSKISSFKMID